MLGLVEVGVGGVVGEGGRINSAQLQLGLGRLFIDNFPRNIILENVVILF